jgi:hypothetical protein
MPYVVKWRAIGGGPTLQSPTEFPVPSAAIDFACANLRQLPDDIWIEGPAGLRIERSVILRGCQDRRPPDRMQKKGSILP